MDNSSSRKFALFGGAETGNGCCGSMDDQETPPESLCLQSVLNTWGYMRVLLKRYRVKSVQAVLNKPELFIPEDF